MAAVGTLSDAASVFESVPELDIDSPLGTSRIRKVRTPSFGDLILAAESDPSAGANPPASQSQDFGRNTTRNRAISYLTGFEGDFGAGGFGEFVAEGGQSFGRNTDLNVALALETGYTGSFGSGGFGQFLQDNPNLQSTVDEVKAAFRDDPDAALEFYVDKNVPASFGEPGLTIPALPNVEIETTEFVDTAAPPVVEEETTDDDLEATLMQLLEDLGLLGLVASSPTDQGEGGAPGGASGTAGAGAPGGGTGPGAGGGGQSI